MKLAVIVAMAKNRVIGINNKLPWHLSEDLKYFKRVTMGKPIIMGRKTFESIGRPLPGRSNIVVSRNPDYQHENIKVVHSLEEAKELAENICFIDGMDEAMVIGGEELYRQALPMSDMLYLTEVHAEVKGDAFFPHFEPGEWEEIARKDFSAAGPNPYDYSFIVLSRK
ncbi:MAG: type 3 dihydrofolate reductase [Gammaproteobacteria bacterium]|nr:type 3 dihydrofolate reductase [Gammaproteobacteria bacterium]MAY02582.1 type 3 dihydrofolate reductase [Gammaproteobacteria bacterium]|tara:strand:- start:581 stop:1084 length:504 start_codon:yes stop_codon:yes gene_type:complete